MLSHGISGARYGERHRILQLQSLLALLSILVLASCRGHSEPIASEHPTAPAPAPLTITTSSLPNGQVGVTYNTSLIASGGTPPYTWSITSGSLPTALSLSPSQGAITGTPAEVVDNASLALQVRDSGSPALTASSHLTLTISPATLSVPLSDSSYLGLTIGQQIEISANTNDVAGVKWAITPSGGLFSAATSLSGANVAFTAPSKAGLYTVTATNVTDGDVVASATIGVTDLAGVQSFHNDLARSGANTAEYILTPTTVNTSHFGKLFSCTVDGAIYAQPLWIANLAIGSSVHNVVFVATQHDSVYAFDADASPCVQLWSANLIDSLHGANTGETTVPSAGPSALVGNNNGNLTPETGITGTPVIDPATKILYVVTKSVDPTSTQIYQRIHAIDLTTGAEKTGSPATITATFPGSGDGGSTVAFNPKTQLQRPGLAFVNDTVFISWASHEDTPPYYGWIIGYKYNGSSLTQTQVFNVDPNASLGGIWMSGGAPAVDDTGNLYLLTGNGTFDANTAGPLANNDYGDSLLQLSSANLTVSQYFTPSDQALGLSNDEDFGAGAAVLVDLPAGSPVAHLVIGGGKDSTLRVLNRDALGGYGDANAWQQLSLSGGLFSAPAFWNDFLLISTAAGVQAYQLDATTGQFNAATSSPLVTGAAPGSPSVSSTAGSNGIVWLLENTGACTIGKKNSSGAPAILEAYDASNLATELWSSALVSTDTPGNSVRNATPTIANGKVYVGTRGSGDAVCSLTGTTGELDVYGVK